MDTLDLRRPSPVRGESRSAVSERKPARPREAGPKIPRSGPPGDGANWSSPLGVYAAQILRYSLLSPAEERALGEASRRGDREARDRLVMANVRLVIAIAGDFLGRGLALDDLVGEGNLGLIRAAKNFDPSFGTRFSTYASYWIKEAIRRALITTTAPVRLPGHLIGLLAKWHRAERDFLRRFGRPPTSEQIAAMLDLSDARRRMVEQGLRAGRFLSADSGERDDALDRTADAQECPEARLDAEERRIDLERRLSILDPRERSILTMHLGLDDEPPRTLKQIGQVFGITREWVRKIEAQALRKLALPMHRPAAPAATASPGRLQAGAFA